MVEAQESEIEVHTKTGPHNKSCWQLHAVRVSLPELIRANQRKVKAKIDTCGAEACLVITRSAGAFEGPVSRVRRNLAFQGL